MGFHSIHTMIPIFQLLHLQHFLQPHLAIYGLAPLLVNNGFRAGPEGFPFVMASIPAQDVIRFLFFHFCMQVDGLRVQPRVASGRHSAQVRLVNPQHAHRISLVVVQGQRVHRVVAAREWARTWSDLQSLPAYLIRDGAAQRLTDIGITINVVKCFGDKLFLDDLAQSSLIHLAILPGDLAANS